jgi:hypothetical protein
MPWLTWPYALCHVGEQGSLSGAVVVRTVVSFQPGWPRDVSGDPRLLFSSLASSTSNLTSQQCDLPSQTWSWQCCNLGHYAAGQVR